jgi:hypothetical protein
MNEIKPDNENRILLGIASARRIFPTLSDPTIRSYLDKLGVTIRIGKKVLYDEKALLAKLAALMDAESGKEKTEWQQRREEIAEVVRKNRVERERQAQNGVLAASKR